MNNLSARAFYGLFNLAFYIFIIFSLIVVGWEVTKWVNPELSTSISFSVIDAHDLQGPNPQKVELTPGNTDVKDSGLTTAQWLLTFRTASFPVRCFMSASSFIYIGFILIILFQLRRFVLSLQRNETFSAQNIKRLQTIGFLFLSIEPFKWVTKYFVNHWLLPSYFNLHLRNRSIAFQLGYELASVKFIFNWIFVGLIVLVIAEVFKQGLKLKEEVDLTV